MAIFSVLPCEARQGLTLIAAGLASPSRRA
jgi:hypothetical protein